MKFEEIVKFVISECKRVPCAYCNHLSVLGGRLLKITKPAWTEISFTPVPHDKFIHILGSDEACSSTISVNEDGLDTDYPAAVNQFALVTNRITHFLDNVVDFSKFEEEVVEHLSKLGWAKSTYYRGIMSIRKGSLTLPLRVSVRTVGTPTISVVSKNFSKTWKVYDSRGLSTHVSDLLNAHWCAMSGVHVDVIASKVKDCLKEFIGKNTITWDKSIPQKSEIAPFKKSFNDAAKQLQSFKSIWAAYSSHPYANSITVIDHKTPDWVITPEDRKNTRYIGTDIFPYEDDL